MGVYLGNIGQIEIVRKSLEGSKYSLVNPSDVNASRNRFSFDFDESYLITGDFIEIKTTDGTDLDFVDATGWANSTVQSSGNWYIFVDELGGIQLYDTFDNSLAGGTTGRIALNAIARNIPIAVTVRSRDSRIVARVIDYELNTSREAVDTTSLTDKYRQQYSSLISGSGRFTAEWDYVSPSNQETVQYLMQLILRTEIGSAFHAKMYIKSPDSSAATGSFDPSQVNDSLWWEFDAIVTNNATAFTTAAIIVSTIDFVVTGPINLRSKTRVDRYLLQENDDKLKLEQDGTSFILLEELD